VLFPTSHHPPLPSLMCGVNRDKEVKTRSGILARGDKLEAGGRQGGALLYDFVFVRWTRVLRLWREVSWTKWITSGTSGRPGPWAGCKASNVRSVAASRDHGLGRRTEAGSRACATPRKWFWRCRNGCCRVQSIAAAECKGGTWAVRGG
jgi:hypothetical protein